MYAAEAQARHSEHNSSFQPGRWLVTKRWALSPAACALSRNWLGLVPAGACAACFLGGEPL